MIILGKMYSKDIVKLTLSLLLFCFFFLSPVNAATPSFTFYPAGGIVRDSSKGFTVDVLIDSGGEEVASAKFTVLFDPSVLRLTKVEKNSTLFVQWPEDESSVDNDNGVALLSGFTQSGTGDAYVTDSTADVMARLTFQVLSATTTTLDWEYGGSNGVFDTQILKDGSPPVNILTVKPAVATFQMGKGLDTSKVNTAVFDGKYLFFGGIVLLLFGGFMVFSRPSMYRKKRGTIVVYDGE